MMSNEQPRLDLAKKIICSVKQRDAKPGLAESVLRSENVASVIDLCPACSKGM
jgi:hypothetical protein